MHTFKQYMIDEMGGDVSVGFRNNRTGEFNPKLADQIEDYLDYQGGDHKFEGKLEQVAKKLITGSWSVYVTILGFISFIILAYSWISATSPILDPISIPLILKIIMFICIGVSLLAVTLYFTAWTIKMMNRMTDGKALGGIGVLLIILGVIGDSADKLLSWFLNV